MTLSKNNLLAKFYTFHYGDTLPRDLCNFFWKIILAFVLLPLTILGIWITPWINEEEGWVRFIVRTGLGITTGIALSYIGLTITAFTKDTTEGLIYVLVPILMLGAIWIIKNLAERKPKPSNGS